MLLPIQAVGFPNRSYWMSSQKTKGSWGHGFTSADALEEVDIGDGDRPRPTFISAKLDPEYKKELVKLLKEYEDCFSWEYYEMSDLD